MNDFWRRRWPIMALVASLVLNGFLGGMLIAETLRPPRATGGPRIADFELRRFEHRLPREAVTRIAAELQPLAPDLTAQLQEMRRLQGEIMRLAAAPEPDRPGIEARLADLHARSVALQAEVQTRTYEALLRLPPEMRRGLARGPGEG